MRSPQNDQSDSEEENDSEISYEQEMVSTPVGSETASRLIISAVQFIAWTILALGLLLAIFALLRGVDIVVIGSLFLVPMFGWALLTILALVAELLLQIRDKEPIL